MVCAVCRREAPVVGLLCENCRDEVPAPIGLLPQYVLATIARPTGDALIDQWGRPHPLETSTTVGRTIESCGIMILEASVSRHHAELSRSDAGWQIRDLGSANGTFLNDVPVTEPTAIAHGDRISIGSVGFYLVVGLGEAPQVEVDPNVITTIQAVERVRSIRNAPEPDQQTIETTAPSTGVPTFVEREDTDVGLPVIPMRIAEPTGGGGGLLEIGDISVQLSTNQAELIGLLARRMLDEPNQPTQVRGFVRSSELLGSLSWDTHDPDDNHVKQLIRRARRLLIRAGLGDLIESRHRFGYRLRLIPASNPSG